MTVKELKELIKDCPDDLPILCDMGEYGYDEPCFRVENNVKVYESIYADNPPKAIYETAIVL